MDGNMWSRWLFRFHGGGESVVAAGTGGVLCVLNYIAARMEMIGREASLWRGEILASITCIYQTVNKKLDVSRGYGLAWERCVLQ